MDSLLKRITDLPFHRMVARTLAREGKKMGRRQLAFRLAYPVGESITPSDIATVEDGRYTVRTGLVCTAFGPALVRERVYNWLPVVQASQEAVVPILGGKVRRTPKWQYVGPARSAFEERLRKLRWQRSLRAPKEVVPSQNVPRPTWEQRNPKAFKIRDTLVKCPLRTFNKFYATEEALTQVFAKVCVGDDVRRFVRSTFARRTRRACLRLEVRAPKIKVFGEPSRFASLDVETSSGDVHYKLVNCTFRSKCKREEELSPFVCENRLPGGPAIPAELRKQLLARAKAVSWRRVVYKVEYTPRLRPTWVSTPAHLKSFFSEHLGIQHQAEGPHGGESIVTEDHGSNVCITTQRVESVATTKSFGFKHTDNFVRRVAAGDMLATYPKEEERWTQLKTFQWKDEASGSRLAKIHFPAALLKLRNRTPNANPFRVHQYWAGDIEIKIQANTNKFMIGQLQCAWLYDTLSDEKIELRENMFTLSQTDHCIVNAGTSSPGSILIKYKNPRPFLPITTRIDSMECLNLGTLYIHVLAPLSTPSTVRKVADITIFVRFPNSHFAGLRSQDVGSFIYPQAGVATALLAVQAAENILNTGGSERDNPPHQLNRQPMVPQTIQSLAYGDKVVEPLSALRLDARGQTPSLGESCDEMDIKYVTRKWGLIEGFKWTSKNLAGSVLKTYEASPIPRRADMMKWTLGSTPVYAVPPVGVVSSLYEYWRGSLELRIDFVGSQFHTGKILIAYSPRELGALSYEEALGCYNMIFDLQEQQTVTFTIPYITNYLVWPRPVGYATSSDVFKAHGKVHIMVVNELTLIENVSDEVQCLCYWRAGEDFNVYVPAQPSVGTSFWTTDDLPSVVTKAQPGYYPWYIGYDANLENGTRAVLRYGWADTHLAQFFNMKLKTYYTVSEKFKKYAITYLNEENESTKAEFFVPVSLDDGYGAVYMGVVASQADAIKYALKPNRDLLVKVANNDDAPYIPSKDSDVNIEFDGTAVQLNIDGSVTLCKFDRFGVPSHQIVHQTGEQDLSEMVCQVAPPVVSAPSESLFGEHVTSLKPFCRRYQPYCVAGIKADAVVGNVAFNFPAIPQGLDLDIAGDDKKSAYYTRCIRDGHIPVILSGYKFYRGGLRFKLITPPSVQQNFWVQHKPMYLTENKVTYPKNFKIGANLYAAGYATYMQSTSVNSAGEFEIPFYKPGTSIYLQRSNLKRTDAASFANLGVVSVGVERLASGTKADKVTDQKITVMYALADDACASTFQGYPPMLLLDEVNEVPTVTKQPMSRTTIEHQALFSIEHKHTMDPELQAFLDSLMESIGDTAVDFISQLGHILINPTSTTMCWATLTIVCKLGLITQATLTKLMAAMSIYARVIARSCDTPVIHPQPGQSLGTIQHQTDTEEVNNGIAQFVSLAWTALSASCGIMVKQPKSLGDFLKTSVLTLNQQMRASHFAFLFIQNHINFFKKIMSWLTILKNPAALFENLSAEDFPVYSHWLDECEQLMDPSNEDMIYSRDAAWANRVEHAYAIGVHICKTLSMSDSRDPAFSKTYQAAKDTVNRLRLKREHMFKRGCSMIQRREPFCLCISGNPGVGKSQIISTLAVEFARAANLDIRGELMFILQSGSQYWDGCRSQPFIELDDFLCVNKSPLQEESLRALFQLKSPAILNPPMAALEDKELRYAPEGMFLTCNEAFPKVSQANEEAIYRRRDMLVRFDLCSAFIDKGITKLNYDLEKVRAIAAEYNIDLSKYEHIDVFIARDPSDPKTLWEGPLSYSSFLSKAQASFLSYRAAQFELYAQKKKQYDSLIKQDDSPGILKEKAEEYERLVRLLAQTLPQEGISYGVFLKAIKTLSETGEAGVASAEQIVRPISSTTLQNLVKNMAKIEHQNDTASTSNPLSEVLRTFQDAEKKAIEELDFTLAGDRLSFGKWSDIKRHAVLDILKGKRFSQVVSCRWPKDNRAIDENDIIRGVDTEKIVPKMELAFYVRLFDTLYKRFTFQQIHKTLLLFGAGYCIPVEEESSAFVGHVALVNPTYSVMNYIVELCRFANNVDDESLDPMYYKGYEPLNPMCKWRSVTQHTLNCSIDIETGKFCWSWFPGEGWDITDNVTVFDEACCEKNCIANIPGFLLKMVRLAKANDNECLKDIPEDKLPRCMQSKTQKCIQALRDTQSKFKIKYDEWVAGPAKSLYENYLCPLFAKCWAFFKKIAPYLALLGSVSLLYSKYAGSAVSAAIVPDSVANLATHQAAYDTVKTVNLRAAKSVFKPPLRLYSHQSEVDLNIASIEHAEALISANTYIIYCYKVPVGEVLDPVAHIVSNKGRLTFIGSNYAIVVKHWFEGCAHKGVTHLLLQNKIKSVQKIIPFDIIKPTFDRQSSIAIVHIPGFLQHRMLVKHFAKQDDHAKPRGKCIVIEPTEHGVNKLSVETSEMPKIDIAACAKDGMPAQHIELAYTYPWSKAGNCGSFLLSPNCNKTIIGYHIAGSPGVGFAEPLVYETFTSYIHRVRPAEFEDYLIKHDETVEPPIQGLFVPVGEVLPGLAKHQSGETSIVPSLIQGVFPVTTQPAPLKQNDPRVEAPQPYSPLYAGVEAMCKPPLHFPQAVVERAEEDLTQLILSKVKPLMNDPKPLEYNEVVTGVPNFPFYDGINMQTSEGFPLSRYRPGGVSTKEWLFQLKQEPDRRVCVGIHQFLAAMLAEKRSQRLAGEIPETVFDDCLKDARLNLEKLKKPGKTRVFSASPIDYTLEFRRYFLHFLAAYKTARFNVEHAIGISADSAEWSMLAGKLVRGLDRPVFITGDYSNFGPTLVPNIVEAVNRIFVCWTVKHLDLDVDERYLEILLIEASSALHCVSKYVYRVFAGSPSGAPHTVEMNSLAGCLYIRCAWLSIMQQNTIRCGFESFYESVRFVVYGDDLIMAVADSIKEQFNNETLAKFFNLYGVKFTDANKDGNIKYVSSLHEVTFLKRGFRNHPKLLGHMLAPLDLDTSVKDTANWVHKQTDMQLATRCAAEDCLANAYGHGPETFNQLRLELSNALSDKGIHWTPRTWDDWDKLHFSGFYPSETVPIRNKRECQEIRDLFIQSTGIIDGDLNISKAIITPQSEIFFTDSQEHELLDIDDKIIEQNFQIFINNINKIKKELNSIKIKQNKIKSKFGITHEAP